METELAALKDSFFQQDDALQSLWQSCSEANGRLDAWDAYLDAAETSAKDAAEARVQSSVHLEATWNRPAQDVTGAKSPVLGGSENKTGFFYLTPDISEPQSLAAHSLESDRASRVASMGN